MPVLAETLLLCRALSCYVADFLKLNFLGAAREVGRSCIRVQAGEVDILLDAGVKMEGRIVRFPSPTPRSADAVVVTHCHLDHMGFLPAFFSSNPRKAPFLCSPPTEPLISLLLADSLKISQSKRQKPYFSPQDLRKLPRYAHCMMYRKPYEFFDGTQVALLDAGHVLGSAQALVTPPKSSGGLPLLYSGDIKMLPSRMHSGADIPDCEVGALLVESTYANREHPDRPALERKFCNELKKAFSEGYSVLIPAFAVGRSQEILMILRENGVNVPTYLDGMAQKATQIALDYSSYLRDGRTFRDAVKHVHFVSEKTRQRLGGNAPAVIIASAGMLEGGPILGYIQRLSRAGRLKIFLTGFQVPGTNGRRLMETGELILDGKRTRVNAEVQFYDFSAHAGKAELYDYVRKVNPQKVFCIHGDEEACLDFAQNLQEEGFDAVAPSANREYLVK